MKHNWKEIYCQNAGKMLGVCRRYVKNTAVAEDLVHDAFLQAIKRVDSYKGLGSIEAWLRRIVINTALEYLRKNKNWVTDSWLKQILVFQWDLHFREKFKKTLT